MIMIRFVSLLVKISLEKTRVEQPGFQGPVWVLH